MKTVSGKTFCRILRSRGWQLRRTKSSHHIYTRLGTPTKISVPVHGDRDLKRGLQRHLMNMAGITESDL